MHRGADVPGKYHEGLPLNSREPQQPLTLAVAQGVGKPGRLAHAEHLLITANGRYY
jgi:hypothetical protein